MSRTLNERLNGPGRKRILALDGGGVRGLVTLGILEQIEAILRARSANPGTFRLSDYFDLIGGTSTGGIIATLLALGYRVDDIRSIYLDLCPKVFYRSWLRRRLELDLRLEFVHAFSKGSVFNPQKFALEISCIIDRILADHGRQGEPFTLGSDLFKTGLAIVTKRIDTSSVWVLTNNPRSKFWAPQSPHWPEFADRQFSPNRDIPMTALVRATASAPFFLQAVDIEIDPKTHGLFLDGGASPFNNPAQELFLMTTLKRFAPDGSVRHSPFGFDWQTGADRLLLCSVGTGWWKPVVDPKLFRRKRNLQQAIDALRSVIFDGMKSSVTWMQALSAPTNPYFVDFNLEAMAGLRITADPLLTFRHVNPRMDKVWLTEVLGPDFAFSERDMDKFRKLDNGSAGNLSRLDRIGRAAGAKLVTNDDFPVVFDTD